MTFEIIEGIYKKYSYLQHSVLGLSLRGELFQSSNLAVVRLQILMNRLKIREVKQLLQLHS